MSALNARKELNVLCLYRKRQKIIVTRNIHIIHSDGTFAPSDICHPKKKTSQKSALWLGYGKGTGARDGDFRGHTSGKTKCPTITGGGTYSADTAIAVPLLKVVRLIM